VPGFMNRSTTGGNVEKNSYLRSGKLRASSRLGAMAQIERLSNGQLEHLEQLLTEQGAPVVPRLQPRASSMAVAALESEFGWSLPEELRLWWGWHNGTDVKPHERAAKASIGPLFELLGAEEALKVTRESRSSVLTLETSAIVRVARRHRCQRSRARRPLFDRPFIYRP
jgi:hypothetical protein